MYCFLGYIDYKYNIKFYDKMQILQNRLYPSKYQNSWYSIILLFKSHFLFIILYSRFIISCILLFMFFAKWIFYSYIISFCRKQARLKVCETYFYKCLIASLEYASSTQGLYFLFIEPRNIAQNISKFFVVEIDIICFS